MPRSHVLFPVIPVLESIFYKLVPICLVGKCPEVNLVVLVLIVQKVRTALAFIAEGIL